MGRWNRGRWSGAMCAAVALACVAVTACLSCLLARPAASAVSGPAVPSVSASVEELIAEIVKAHGGREALSKVRSIYTRGNTRVFQQDRSGTVLRYLRRDGRLRVELGFGPPETRILSGTEGWLGVGTPEVKKADESSREGLLFQYLSMDLPFSLADGLPDARFLRKDKVGHATVDVVSVRTAGGRELTLYADQTTHLIFRVATSILIGTERRDVNVELTEYREVSGIKAPHQILYHVGATPVSRTTIAEIIFNKEINDGLFKP